MGKSLIRILLPKFLPTCAVPHSSQVTALLPQEFSPRSISSLFLFLFFCSVPHWPLSLPQRSCWGFSKASLRYVSFFSLRGVPHYLFLSAHVTPHAVSHCRRRVGTTFCSCECVSCSLIVANLFSE